MSFQWEGKIYVFQVLPFGMSALPWLFTHFIGFHHLCRQGMWVMDYINDFIVIGHSHQQALKHMTLTLRLLNQLGWQVNFEKSDLMLSQSKEFLEPRNSSLIQQAHPCSRCLHASPVRCGMTSIACCASSGRKLATVISQGVALTKAILPAKLLLCNAYCNIAQRANWNSFVSLSTATILDLEDWHHSLLTWNGCLANLQPCNVLLNTNTSLTGWGASLGAMMSSPTHTSAGWWPPS